MKNFLGRVKVVRDIVKVRLHAVLRSLNHKNLKCQDFRDDK